MTMTAMTRSGSGIDVATTSHAKMNMTQILVEEVERRTRGRVDEVDLWSSSTSSPGVVVAPEHPESNVFPTTMMGNNNRYHHEGHTSAVSNVVHGVDRGRRDA